MSPFVIEDVSLEVFAAAVPRGFRCALCVEIVVCAVVLCMFVCFGEGVVFSEVCSAVDCSADVSASWSKASRSESTMSADPVPAPAPRALETGVDTSGDDIGVD